ncbi:MAG: hypothetical protein IT444_12670 [Phycisphaeraceae bacterium]|nr:hypothetical protein [Phycisphaeraceae bacterium]
MMNPSNSQPEDGTEPPGLLELIRKIHAGTVVPRTLTIEQRRACVEHLTGEGYTVVEMAQVLKVDERTIARDKVAIQQANAIEPSPQLVQQIVGRLASEAELCISRIRRVTRDKDTPAATKVEGERACFQILGALTHHLQSLGYMPTAAQRLSANVFVETPTDAAILQAEWERLQALTQDVAGAGLDPKIGLVFRQLLQDPANPEPPEPPATSPSKSSDSTEADSCEGDREQGSKP